jgi:transketolase
MNTGENMSANYSAWSKDTISIRENILKMITKAASGHPGGSLSLVEILYTLFAKDGVMKHDPKNPARYDRDRLVLSKGHGVPALYAILHHFGYDITAHELDTLRELGSRLQGHPDRVRIPYVEASTGSLGQGASIAQGIAMAYKLDKNPHQVFCILGDGEMQEGQIWEVALSAPFKKLNNLTLILDYNKGQIDGPVSEVLDLEPLKPKWESFGWNTLVVDGHNFAELQKALSTVHPTKPTMIIANTIKGKGVSFMEGQIGWHGKAPSQDELAKAIAEIKTTSIGL